MYIECCFAHKNNYFNKDKLLTTERLVLYAYFIPLVYYKKNFFMWESNSGFMPLPPRTL